MTTKFISNITGSLEGNTFHMFKACDADGNSCERVNMNGRNGLVFNSNRLEGFQIEAEDPRMFECNGQKYVAFICLSPYEGQNRCIALTPFDEFKPVALRIRGVPYNFIEKNWAPFVKDNQIHFVYNYDPLVILKYDLNPEGWCDVVFNEGAQLPFRTDLTFLRGGSNLVPFRDNLLIGGCHSRIFLDGVFYHFTHIVLLDIENWKVVHLSKPVRFEYSKEDIGTVDGVIYDIGPNCIQDPISLYKNGSGYSMTINVRDCISLLYDLSFDLETSERPSDLQAFTKRCALEIVIAHKKQT